MQDVRSNIRPELPKHIRERITPDCPSISGSDSHWSAIRAWVICQRDSLRDTPAKNFGKIKVVLSVVVWSDKNAGRRIDSPLPNPSLAFGVVPLVLMEYGRQREQYQVIAICPVDKASPVVLSKARRTFSELRMNVSSFCHERRDSREKKS